MSAQTPYYKVLSSQGKSCNGGTATWNLPDGDTPGDWMPEIKGPLALCSSGYHLTREPALWWQEGAECFETEWEGEHAGYEDDDKIAVRRCRLVRKLTDADLAGVNIFMAVTHRVFGSAMVAAFGSAMVVASGSATVRASGSNIVNHKRWKEVQNG